MKLSDVELLRSSVELPVKDKLAKVWPFRPPALMSSRVPPFRSRALAEAMRLAPSRVNVPPVIIVVPVYWFAPDSVTLPLCTSIVLKFDSTPA